MPFMMNRTEDKQAVPVIQGQQIGPRLCYSCLGRYYLSLLHPLTDVEHRFLCAVF